MSEMRAPSRRDCRRIVAAGLAALLGAGALLAGAVAAPTRAEERGWRSLDPEAMSASQRERLERARSARNGLAQHLQSALKEGIKESGPAGAIAVCRESAPAVAREISEKEKLKIGRTSFRLRNPANAPPSWAAAAVERREAEPAYFEGPSGELGALFPIRIQEPCLTCHGPEDRVPGPVRERLAELYPEDRATGFGQGDLRGWFWVEVP